MHCKHVMILQHFSSIVNMKTYDNVIFRKSQYVEIIDTYDMFFICQSLLISAFVYVLYKNCCFEISIKTYCAVQVSEICTLILAFVYIFKYRICTFPNEMKNKNE